MMNIKLAMAILGINRTRDGDLKPMIRALSLFPILNSGEDNERLKAAKFVVKNWQEYQAACNRARDIMSRAL